MLLCYTSTARSHDEISDLKNTESATENERVLNETLTKYGDVEDFTKLGLPGPEILTDRKRFDLSNQFVGDSTNYTLR